MFSVCENTIKSVTMFVNKYDGKTLTDVCMFINAFMIAV